MKIAVIGCGAMGSIYAGLLAARGHDVLAIDRDATHVAAINTKGLRLSGASGERTAKLTAREQCPDEPMDLVIISVKARHVRQAAEDSRGLLGPETHVVTIQNGLGSAAQVAEVLGEDRLIVGVAQGFGASRPEAGHAHHNAMKVIRMGAHSRCPRAALEAVCRCFTEAGLETEAVDDVLAGQWEKLICNVAYSAPCAVTGMTVGEVMQDDYMGAVSRMAAMEAWRVARALNVAIDVDDPVTLVRDFASRMPDAKPSVLLDVEAGKPSEVDVINGAIPREARKVALEAPVNATLTALVLTLERRGRVGSRLPNEPNSTWAPDTKE